MAEKQNSSEPKVSTLAAKRRANLPSLSKIIKSQTTSFQRRSANTTSSKTAGKGGGGFKTFIFKVIVGTGAVYLSGVIGVWAEPEESRKIAQKMRDLVRCLGHETMLSEDFRGDVMSKFNDTKAYLKTQIEGVPEELKAYYEKTEKYMNDLVRGKKS